MGIDQETYLQVVVANMYIRKHKTSARDFVRLDEECEALGFLRDGYGPFHLTGMQGVLREADEYISLSNYQQGH